MIGECNANKLELTLIGASDISGIKVDVDVVEDGVVKDLFVGIVDSAKMQANGLYRDLVIYDELYYIRNIDVTKWYNDIFPQNTSTVTCKELRDSLCDYVGLQQQDIVLVNDEAVIKKTLQANSILAGDVLKCLCQMNGVFGNISRSGIFEYISLMDRTSDVTNNYQNSSTVETYEVKALTGLKIVNENNETGIIIGNEENVYTLSGNFLIYGNTTEELESIATNIYDKISNITYYPADIKLIQTDLDVCLGDKLTFADRHCLVMELKISGIQLYSESISSKGSMNRNTVTDDVNAKLSKIQNEVTRLGIMEANTVKTYELDAVKAEITDAVIGNLGVEFLKVTEAQMTYATITNLAATNASIQNLEVTKLSTSNLSAEVAKLGYATVDSLSAISARISTLESTQITTSYLQSNFADIGLANVETAAIATLFTNIGLIQNATIVEGHITGYLDSVEVNAESITAGTLAVDRLVIRGSEQSLVYELNNITGALQAANVDTLNGEILTDRTINAAKIIAKSITANEIAVGAITANEIAADTITANEIDMNNLTANAAFINAIATNSVVVGANQNALAAITTATTADTKASTALNTANSANSTANTANTNASNAVTTANSAKSTATTANTNASAALSTANTANTNASVAVTTANGLTTRLNNQSSNLVINGFGEYRDATNWSGVVSAVVFYDGEDYPDGCFGSFIFLGAAYTNQLIPYNPTEDYLLSATMKSYNGQDAVGCYLSIVPYDADGNEISYGHTNWMPGTTTTLAQDLKKGDTVIHFVSLTNWANTTQTYQRGFLFWNYKDSKGKTYEKETYSRSLYLDRYTDDNSVNRTSHTITLKSAWTGETIPAGTYVSQSTAGGVYIYPLGNQLSGEWKDYQMILKSSSDRRLLYTKSLRFRTLFTGSTTMKIAKLYFGKDTVNSTELGIVQNSATAANNAAAAAQSTANSANTLAGTANSTANSALNRATYHYGTCATGAATVAKVVTLSGFTLYTGAQITVQFTYANTAANPTLNVNGTGAKYIRVNNANITSAYYWKANNTVTFIYDGTYWTMADSSANSLVASWCSANDVTLIDGGKIYTGSITADKLAANAITADKLKVTELSSIGATIGGWIITNTSIYDDAMGTDGYKRRAYIQSMDISAAENAWVFSVQKGTVAGETPSAFNALWRVTGNGNVHGAGVLTAGGLRTWSDYIFNCHGKAYIDGAIYTTGRITSLSTIGVQGTGDGVYSYFSGNVSVGTTGYSTGYNLYVKGSQYINGTSASSSYALYVTGNTYLGGSLTAASVVTTSGANLDTINNNYVSHTQLKCIHTASGTGGSMGYVRVAVFKIGYTYCNSPIVLKIAQRGRSQPTNLYITFASTNSTAPPGVSVLYTGASITAYMHKYTSSEWHLYIYKSEGWDIIDILECRIPSYLQELNRVTITWANVHSTITDYSTSAFTKATKTTE